MKRIAVAALLAALCPRLALADEPEETVYKLGEGVVAATAISAAIVEGHYLFGDRTPSLRRSARELCASHLALAIGTTLAVTGYDQHDTWLEGVGLAMTATAMPALVDGALGVTGNGDGTADDRHAAGVTELAFALPELALEGLAFAESAKDPVDHVRRAGEDTSLALAIPTAALAAHGIYLLATPVGETKVALVPTGRGVVAVGRF